MLFKNPASVYSELTVFCLYRVSLGFRGSYSALNFHALHDKREAIMKGKDSCFQIFALS